MINQWIKNKELYGIVLFHIFEMVYKRENKKKLKSLYFDLF